MNIMMFWVADDIRYMMVMMMIIKTIRNMMMTCAETLLSHKPKEKKKHNCRKDKHQDLNNQNDNGQIVKIAKDYKSQDHIRITKVHLRAKLPPALGAIVLCINKTAQVIAINLDTVPQGLIQP